MHVFPYPWYSFRGEMEDVSKEQILLGKHDLNHNESTQTAYCVKQLYQQKHYQTIWISEICHCPLCLLAQERQLAFLRRVLLDNCMGAHNRYMSTRGFPRSGRVGIIFPIKSKYTEEDYITYPVSSTCLDKEAKYLKCLFLG